MVKLITDLTKNMCIVFFFIFLQGALFHQQDHLHWPWELRWLSGEYTDSIKIQIIGWQFVSFVFYSIHFLSFTCTASNSLKPFHCFYTIQLTFLRELSYSGELDLFFILMLNSLKFTNVMFLCSIRVECIQFALIFISFMY